jgi:hypothetical protein
MGHAHLFGNGTAGKRFRPGSLQDGVCGIEDLFAHRLNFRLSFFWSWHVYLLSVE